MDVMERIKQTIDNNPVVLFMKGTPQFPMCGFSMRAAKALKECGASFHHVNVLQDPEVRASLPQFANFPTFPQLYIAGELIGGCDITEDLHASGELKKLLDEARSS